METSETPLNPPLYPFAAAWAPLSVVRPKLVVSFAALSVASVEPLAAPVEPFAAPSAAPVEPLAAPVEPLAVPDEPFAAPVEPSAVQRTDPTKVFIEASTAFAPLSSPFSGHFLDIIYTHCVGMCLLTKLVFNQISHHYCQQLSRSLRLSRSRLDRNWL